MSYVTDVLLLLDTQERLGDNVEIVDEIPAILVINVWLTENRFGVLDKLHEHVLGGGKAMQSLVYGGAFNFLKTENFIRLVWSQAWQQPTNVQLLIKSEDEERFRLCGPAGIKSTPEFSDRPDEDMKEFRQPVEKPFKDALFRAAALNDTDAIRRLVGQGADPNFMSEHGHTPLHNACITRKADAVRTLLEFGADPNQRYTYRSPMDGRVEAFRTALMYATSAPVAEALLYRGADPNAADSAGETALMLAAWRGHSEVVTILLAAGADPRMQRPSTDRSAAITARELAEQKIAGWREVSPSMEIARRIAVLDRICMMLAEAEKRTSSPPGTSFGV